MSETLQGLEREMALSFDAAMFAERIGFPPDDWQKRFYWSPAKRKIANCSRQTGKSQTAANKATHRARYTRNRDVLIIAPTLRQSVEMQGKVKDAIRGARLIADYAFDLENDSKMSCTLENGSRIISLPGQNPGNIRGYSRPVMVIIDEAAYASDELYHAVRPMLATAPDCELILLSTPHGKRGFFYDTWISESGRWEKYLVPAEACPRISDEFLEEEREALGDLIFEQEYHNAFVDTEEQVFGTKYIEAAFTDEVEPLFSDVTTDEVGAIEI